MKKTTTTTKAPKKTTKAPISALQELRAITQKLTLWLAQALENGLPNAEKPKEAQGLDWLFGPKNSLLAMLVTLVDMSIALEKAASTAPEQPAETGTQAVSDADAALVKAFLSRLPQ